MKRLHGILGNLSAVWPHVGGVLVVQPFHLEMQVHVIQTLTQTVFLVLCAYNNSKQSRHNILVIIITNLTMIVGKQRSLFESPFFFEKKSNLISKLDSVR